jgi:hypothetical protein
VSGPSNIVIVYDSRTKTVKRWIVPDDDAQADRVTWHAPSSHERVMKMPHHLAASLDDIQNFVTTNGVADR